MGPLGQAIYGDKYGVIAMILREFCDQVDRDNLPSMVWDTVGHKLSHWGYRKRLCSVTEVAAFHVLGNITSHTRPPVGACYQFSRLPPS